MQSTLSTVEIARCETGLSHGATHAPDRLLFLGALMEKCLSARRASFPRISSPRVTSFCPDGSRVADVEYSFGWVVRDAKLSSVSEIFADRAGSLELCPFYKDLIGENVTGLIHLWDDWFVRFYAWGRFMSTRAFGTRRRSEVTLLLGPCIRS